MKNENSKFSNLSGLFIPVVLVLIGAALVYGINALLTTERSYKDLVQELQTKTFGNRWVAAFELSKYLNTASIPKDEIPWLIDNLSSVYRESVDAKTRSFIIKALGSLKSPEILPVLAEALKDTDSTVQFHALVELGNFPREIQFDWFLVSTFLNSPDPAFRQITILTLANHRVPGAADFIEPLLKDSNISVRYSAATGLIYFQKESAIPLLREILSLRVKTVSSMPVEKDKIETESSFSAVQVESLKLNVLNALEMTGWDRLLKEVKKLSENNESIRVSGRAKEVLKSLKN